MLKDLDDRKQEPVTAAGHQPPYPTQSKSYRNVYWALALVVLVNLMAWLIWSFYQENQVLKAQSSKANSQAMQVAEIPPVDQNKSSLSNSHQPTAPETSSAPEVKTLAKTEALSNSQSAKETAQIISQPEAEQSAGSHQSQVQNETVVKVDNVNNVEQSLGAENLVAEKQIQKSTVDKPINVNSEPSQEVVAPKPTLSVARKQLSPRQLVARKTQQAEAAISKNELAKAEELYEDILLIDANQQETRKQLAALWFGRQAYQDALNLLKQGSALDYNNSEFRLMKARIYLTMGRAENALSEFLVLKDETNIEYQALIATTAQQLKRFPEAITAYQKLTQLQSTDGRWWLGLAIAHDTNAEFEAAKAAYRQTIELAGVSDSSLVFARQRLQELGE